MSTVNPPPEPSNASLPMPRLVALFLAFAFAYFLSALVRSVTATLSPTLTADFGLQASDLGLLAGGYFLGFAFTQLPLGTWLDKHGPKRVVLAFLTLAVAGAVMFSQATSFTGLMVARVLTGAGLSACLMAPLTGYRRWFSGQMQMRANSWMLMTGSLGMLASTLPVQWLLPVVGWRPIFIGLAALVLLSMLAIAISVPAWQAPKENRVNAPVGIENIAIESVANGAANEERGYGPIWRSRYFWSLMPMGLLTYGGMVAMQSLWAGPWMLRVAGFTAQQSAFGLFLINVTMLVTFWLWGMLTPSLSAKGWPANRLLAWGGPLSLLAMLLIIASPAWSLPHLAVPALWALFCACSSVSTLAQPAVGMAFKAALAGRALSAFNLVIFVGVFIVQWAIGLAIDALMAQGANVTTAFQVALALFWVCSAAAYLWFIWREKPFGQPAA